MIQFSCTELAKTIVVTGAFGLAPAKNPAAAVERQSARVPRTDMAHPASEAVDLAGDYGLYGSGSPKMKSLLLGTAFPPSQFQRFEHHAVRVVFHSNIRYEPSSEFRDMTVNIIGITPYLGVRLAPLCCACFILLMR